MTIADEADLQAAMERIAEKTRRAILRALRGDTHGFALTSHWPPEKPRVVHLFGKPYWWDRLPDGRLTLEPARWLTNGEDA